MSHVVICGAGISGLSLAFRLQTRGHCVTILDSTNRVGGCIRTDRADGFVVEAGPNGFLDGKPSTLQLARDLGLGNRLIAGSEAARKHRYLYLNESIRELPGGIAAFAKSPLLSVRGKLRLLAEPLIHRGKGGPESVAAFAKRRFGQEAADTFIDALVTGIHGGDPAYLDIRAAFPRLANWERNAGSVVRGMIRAGRVKGREARARSETTQPQRMWSLPYGLGELTDAIVARLSTPPILGVGVSRLERIDTGWRILGDGHDYWDADAVVLACPAHTQAAMLADVDPKLAEEIAGIAYNRIAVVALGYHESDVPRRIEGFGFIAPQNTRRDLLGVQWCSSIYPGRAPAGMVLWRALCGGWSRPEVVDWSDERLVVAVATELQRVHGVTVVPAFVRIIRWPLAIPQYAVGHPERVARIEALRARHPGLILAGNAYRGVALNDCTAEADRLSESLGRGEQIA